ncbi:hypothetical protein MTO96_001051 [Rhipicephalus appendiculatus]
MAAASNGFALRWAALVTTAQSRSLPRQTVGSGVGAARRPGCCEASGLPVALSLVAVADACSLEILAPIFYGRLAHLPPVIRRWYGDDRDGSL